MLTHEKKTVRPTYICSVANKNYQKSLWLIVITAVMLIAVQGYYVYQNYQANKQRFILDMQQSLDASIENYFASKAKKNIYVLNSSSIDTVIHGNSSVSISSVATDLDAFIIQNRSKDSSESKNSYSFSWSTEKLDSLQLRVDSNERKIIKDFDFDGRIDTGRMKHLQFLTQRVMLSISEDLLDLGKLYTEMEKELDSRNLKVNFKLLQENSEGKTAIGDFTDTNLLSAEANSAYLGRESKIRIEFENATLIILQNGLTELLISFLLISLVIGTLIHLYHTIFRQKQLAAIKDDLISNITHEFKTPIATIFSALEGVTSFNERNDPEKTRRYISLSNEQLHKLNNMVEKMLETATIDQGRLSLNREDIEVVSWTQNLIEQFLLIAEEKQIHLESQMSSFVTKMDPFHLENTLSNLLDNALKYGGDKIIVRLTGKGENVIWEVEDNGRQIPKSQQEKIFDKLYRIPTGNTHDVKGFGIGLYYARTIAKMHEGSLTLHSTEGRTTFTLTI